MPFQRERTTSPMRPLPALMYDGNLITAITKSHSASSGQTLEGKDLVIINSYTAYFQLAFYSRYSISLSQFFRKGVLMKPQNKNEIKQKLSTMGDLFHSYHISRVGLFGSCVHDAQNEKSDIDLLVELNQAVDLFAYVNLADILSQTMHHRVDLVTLNGIKPALRSKILNEVEWIEGI